MNGASVANKILAVVLALVLFLGGLLAAVEIVLAQAGRHYWLVPRQQWSSWLHRQQWETPVIRTVLIVLLLLGVLLLLAALRRGKPRDLAVPSQVDAVEVSMSRREVEKTVAAAARQTSGVQSATASASRRSITVNAQTLTRATGDLRDQTRAAVAARLDDLGLSALRLKVKLTSKEGRR